MLGDRWNDGKLEHIGAVFFESGIESVRIPSTLREIRVGALYGCKNLKSVEFSEGLEKIGAFAFAGSGIERVVLP